MLSLVSHTLLVLRTTFMVGVFFSGSVVVWTLKPLTLSLCPHVRRGKERREMNSVDVRLYQLVKRVTKVLDRQPRGRGEEVDDEHGLSFFSLSLYACVLGSRE